MALPPSHHSKALDNNSGRCYRLPLFLCGVTTQEMFGLSSPTKSERPPGLLRVINDRMCIKKNTLKYSPCQDRLMHCQLAIKGSINQGIRLFVH